ncbi:MAG: hypothetical protein RJA22_385 [Verrucomicrobiota bacterium]|jgi:hypothetical protein
MMHMNSLFLSLAGARRAFLPLLLLALAGSLGHAQFHGGAIFNDPFGPDGTTRVKVGDWVTNRISLLNFDECNDSLEVNEITFSVQHFVGLSNYTVSFPVPLLLRQSVFENPAEAFYETSFRWQVLPGDENLPQGVIVQNAQWRGTDQRNALPWVINPTPPAICEPGVPDTFLLTFPAQVVVSNAPPSTNLCVLEAVSDKWNQGGSRHAVWMPGIYTDFIFNPQFGGWTSNGDMATLTGTIRRRDDLSSGFQITVNLSGKTTVPPVDSPHLDLDPEAYIWNGGPIDPATWCYYEEFTGVFVGFGRYDGAIVDIIRHGPAWQLGVGANNKNDNFGAAAWFTWMLRTPFGSLPMSGIGDFNLDIFECIPASLGDLVWFDANQNGQQDGDPELGLPGVTVQLLTCSGTLPLLTQESDAAGAYLFTNLQAGSYRIQVVLPANTAITPAVNVGNDATDSDVDPLTRRSGCVTLSNTLLGSNNRSLDVGLIGASGPAPAPRLLGIAPEAGSRMILSVEGPRLRRYLVETTGDGAPGWEPAATVWNLDGTLHFIDPMQLPSCLYRIKLLP